MASDESATASAVPAAVDERFVIELEFVQCLANLGYLQYLAQSGYMKDPAFVNYLRYLQYWKQPEYARFITYPYCLYYLDMLQDEGVRRALAHHETVMHFHSQQYYTWRQSYRMANQLLQLSSSSESSSATAALSGPAGTAAATPSSDQVVTV